MPEFSEEVVVPYPPETVCAFFRSPEAVAAISDPSVGAVLKSAPEQLDAGSVVELELMAFGTTHAVTNEVAEAAFPNRFVEVQRSGPLKAYRHEHRFEPTPDGTRVVDAVEFEPPGGLAGLLMSADAIESQLADSIDYRNRQLAAAIGRFANRGEA